MYLNYLWIEEKTGKEDKDIEKDIEEAKEDIKEDKPEEINNNNCSCPEGIERYLLIDLTYNQLAWKIWGQTSRPTREGRPLSALERVILN